MFLKYCNISKTLGRGSITPLPLLYQGEGMTLRVSPRVKLNSGENCLYGNLVSPKYSPVMHFLFSVINYLHVLV